LGARRGEPLLGGALLGVEGAHRLLEAQVLLGRQALEDHPEHVEEARALAQEGERPGFVVELAERSIALREVQELERDLRHARIIAEALGLANDNHSGSAYSRPTVARYR